MTARIGLVPAALAGGLSLLVAPLALQAFVVLSLAAALAAWKWSGWLERRLPRGECQR